MKLILFLSLILSFNAFSMAEKKAKAIAEKKGPVTQTRSQVYVNLYFDKLKSVKSEIKMEKSARSNFLGIIGSGSADFNSDFGDFSVKESSSMKVIFRPSSDYLIDYFLAIEKCEILAQQNLLFGNYRIQIAGSQTMFNANIKKLIEGKEKSIEITLTQDTEINCGTFE